MAPLNLTYLHGLQYSLFEHLFSLYYNVINVKFDLYPLCSHTLYNGFGVFHVLS